MLSPPSPSCLRAWLELCRISNLPTVWSNVLTGSAIYAGFGRRVVDEDGNPVAFAFQPDWEMIGIMSLAMSLFYIAGMALNDLADADTDAAERPHRPIPSGRVSKRAALYFSLLCFQAGLIIVWYYKPGAMIYILFLLAAIIAYDFCHKRFKSSVLLMGACRSLVVLAAATGTVTSHFDRIAIPMALVLGLYVIGITIIARGETEDRIDGRKWLAVVMPVIVLVMIGRVRPDHWRWAALAAFVLCMWLERAIRSVFARPPKTVQAVLTWLAGICLVDAYFLTLLGAPRLALIAGACFALTAWGHRKILGT